jgi:uncharacterized protein
MDSAALAKEPFVSITTFKRDGTPVSVPVWCAADNGSLLVFSEADSWKVKRIRRNAHVRLAPCSARGTPRGPGVDADASLVEETTTVEALLVRKYGWAWRGYRALMSSTALIRRLRRQLPTPWLTISITLRQAAPDQPNLRGCSYRSSSGVEGFEVGDQGVVDLAGQVAFDAAHDLRLGQAFFGPSFDIGAGAGTEPHPDHHGQV